MKKELLTYQDPKSPVSEVFRTLRTNIQFMNTDKKLRTLLVTSTFPGEGKSWVTSNLAVTFAQAGKKVILIDADMRKGRQYKILDVLPKPGLSNYLSNMDADEMEISNAKIDNYIQNTDVENLRVIVAGNVPPNPSELLVSSRMRHLITELKDMCDIIIIDGTPCELVTDSIILSRFVDSTVIVTAQKETKKDNLARIVKNIKNVGGKIAGVVINKVDISTKKYNQSYYYGSISGGVTDSHRTHHRRNSGISFENLLKMTDEDDESTNNEEINLDKTYEKVYSENQNDNEEDVNNNYSDDDLLKQSQKIINKIKQTHASANKNKDEEKEQKNNKEENNDIVNSVEKAESAKDIPDEKASEIINLVNSYIKSEQDKHERKDK